MAAGIIQGLFGLVMAYWLAKRLNNKGSKVAADEVVSFEGTKLPGFAAAISAPLVAILLLALRPGRRYRGGSADCTASRWFGRRPDDG